jgi:iron complex outermembrane recepter protein
VIRDPKVKDEIKSFRLSFKRPLQAGPFSGFTGGVNYTQRDKSVAKNETRLVMPPGTYSCETQGTPNVTPCNRDIPSAAVQAPLDMSWMGVPQFIRLNVPYLVDSGALGRRWPRLDLKTNDSAVVREDHHGLRRCWTSTPRWRAFRCAATWACSSCRHDQRAEGWEYRGDNDNPDFSLLYQAQRRCQLHRCAAEPEPRGPRSAPT